MSERKFFDDTTYNSPAMFLNHATNELWHGPINSDGNLHWGKCEGFKIFGEPIFIYRCSELPDGDYIRIETRPPKTQEERLEALLNAIDRHGACGAIQEAREELR